MGEALTFKNIEQTYALIQKEEFKKPELNPLIYKTNDIKGVILDPILPLEFDVGTDFKEKDILSLKNEHLDEKSFLEWETTFFPYTNEKIFNPDLLKAFSYAQRQKQEEFLSQKDGSFLPIGVLKGVLKKGTDKTVFVFDWLSGVCDDRPDLFIGGLFEDSKQFRLGVFSLLNVRLVYDEPDLHYLSTVLKIKNAKYVMNFEKKKVFDKVFLVNVPKVIKAQLKGGENRGITRV